MNQFELSGKISKVETLTSSRGNPFVMFTLDDDVDKFDLTVFGDLVNKCKGLKADQEVLVKGVLRSREYTDKNGKLRRSTEARIQWIETTNSGAEIKSSPPKTEQPSNSFDDIPF